MIKASAKLKDGWLVVLGLSDGNVAKLKQDDPIIFRLADVVKNDTRLVCVTYKRPDGKAAFPKGFDQTDGIGLAFSDKALDEMSRRCIDMPCGEINFVLFRGKDEAAMEAQMRGLIDYRTEVKRSGYAPADKPPSRN